MGERLSATGWGTIQGPDGTVYEVVDLLTADSDPTSFELNVRPIPAPSEPAEPEQPCATCGKVGGGGTVSGRWVGPLAVFARPCPSCSGGR